VREEIEHTLELIHSTCATAHRRRVPVYARRADGAGDRQQLRQLFLNLFTNASDAMRRAGR